MEEVASNGGAEREAHLRLLRVIAFAVIYVSFGGEVTNLIELSLNFFLSIPLMLSSDLHLTFSG